VQMALMQHAAADLTPTYTVPGFCSVVAWLLLGAGAIFLVLRAGSARDTRAARGRRRDLLFGLALLVLAAGALISITGAYPPGSRSGWQLAVALGAVGVAIARPRWLPALLVGGLVALGLYGFVEARANMSPTDYGFLPAGYPPYSSAVLPQAYLFLVLGGVVALRAIDRGSPGGRVLLGRLAGLSGGARLRALLLPVVVVMAAAAVAPAGWMGPGIGTGLSVLLLAVVSLVVRQAPRPAAAVATCGLFIAGLAGLLLATQSGWRWPAPYGLLNVGGQYWGYWTGISTAGRFAVALQGLAFLAAAAALAPRTMPAAGRLLGTGDLELIARVRRLTESRAVAVDTAAADLRRLERDLHDGAQARLVALGMQLRAVEKLIATSPEAAAALVAEARDTSARALADLRQLVRGVHPPVLADRGLADAIRALALDSPLHVETETDLDGRAPAPIETACYFAVAELLTNAAKHSGARDARVAVEHHGRMLRLSVTDFGLGGADPASGTGLAGIERRLAAFDGILAVSSPAGGPTTIVIEVPCALAPAPLRS
jgi:signal transduction histidine kinase